MPHISIEVTPRLAYAVPFEAVFRTIHRTISERGDAVLDDWKSRVVVTDMHLVGDDDGGEFIVARLIMTRHRPPETQRAMAKLIHDELRDAIAQLGPACWWQCCVLIEPFEPESYLKTDSRSV